MLGHRAGTCLTLVETSKQLSSVVVSLTLHQQCMEVLGAPHPPLEYSVMPVFHFHLSDGCTVVSHRVFNMRFHLKKNES